MNDSPALVRLPASSWKRALTIRERIAMLPPPQSLSPHPPTLHSAQERLARWRSQRPFAQDGYFSQRLAMDGISEHDLLHLLATEDATLPPQYTTPFWLVQLNQALSLHQRAYTLPFNDQHSNSTAFLSTMKPLLIHGLQRFEQGIQTLRQTYTALPFDPETVQSLLFPSLAQQVVAKINTTLILELNIQRMQGQLQGTTSTERFHHFLQHLSQPESLQAFLSEYIVLARQLVEIIEEWVEGELEFLTRLCADWSTLCTQFSPQRDPGVLVACRGRAGDPHCRGRSVKILQWSSGLRLVYKPRSLAVDLHFQELLVWLNKQGQTPPLRTLSLLSRESYGWVEFVRMTRCSTKDQVGRFYQRQGSYLALLYLLEAADIHAENIIAAGEHPVLVDLEALFQPDLDQESSDPTTQILQDSVISVGLLPSRLWKSDQSAGIDVSGLGSPTTQQTPLPVQVWKETGTDEMHIQHEHTTFSLGKHRPRLQKDEVNLLDYSEDVLIGFTTTYRILLQQRERLAIDLLPRFCNDEIRYLFRPTAIYSRLLRDACHPNVLRDAMDLERVLDRLWISVPQQPYLQQLIAAERRALLRNDIPLFTTTASSYALQANREESLEDVFGESGITNVYKKLARLSEDDLLRQCWIIRASFTSLLDKKKQLPRARLSLHPTHSQATSESLLSTAQLLGDRLCQQAHHFEEYTAWLDVHYTPVHGWQSEVISGDLYRGSAGITLFLAYLGTLSGCDRYTELAQLALHFTRRQVAEQQTHQTLALGAFNGAASYIYLLSHLGTLWHDPTLYEEAATLATQLSSLIDTDEHYDVIGGSAGCIAALLSLFAVAPSPLILQLANRCGTRLLSQSIALPEGLGWLPPGEQVPLAGMAHGNAGIALNLLRLYALTHDTKLLQTAQQAIAYERSLFSSQHQNWPDLRTDPTEQQSPGRESRSYNSIAWCHGAPGIALARLASLPYSSDPMLAIEIDAGLHTMLKRGFRHNHTLCHGDMGNLDILLTAVHLLSDPYYTEQLQRLTPMLLESIDNEGWTSELPLGVDSPGLMTGLAGTGYALLRLAAPHRVPGVLVLAPPIGF